MSRKKRKEKGTHVLCKLNLPRSVCLSGEESGSTGHQQDRRTITPPSTPSSLARKGEPRHKRPVVIFSSFHSFHSQFSFDYGNKGVGWVRLWKMPIFWHSLLFIPYPGWMVKGGLSPNRQRQCQTLPRRHEQGWRVHDRIQNGIGNTARLKAQNTNTAKNGQQLPLISSSGSLTRLSLQSGACHQKLSFTTLNSIFNKKPQSLWQTFKNAPDGLHK